MDLLILKQDIVETISRDGMLYGKVATALNRTPGSLRKILADNDPKLTQASVLRIIKDHLGVTEDSELLTNLSVEA